MQERLEATVSGRVQMVMFRAFTMDRAKKLKLTGEVQNMKDGTVRVIAEGERANLDELVTHLQKGSFFADVKDVAVSWTKATGQFKRFDIRYE